MWSNDMKCKCMFLFDLKHLACKGLTYGKQEIAKLLCEITKKSTGEKYV